MSPHRLPPKRNTPGREGGTLLGLAVAVVIVSGLIALGLPIAQRMLIRSRTAAVVDDLRAFSAAFRAYAAKHGDWPPGDGTPGALPPGMGKFLSAANWRQRTPIGGHYAWDPNSRHQGFRHRAALVITSTPDSAVSTDPRQLQPIDAEIDDGNLASGNFLLGYRNYPVYVLEH